MNKPTEDGFYWVTRKDGTSTIVDVVKDLSNMISGGYFIYMAGREEIDSLLDYEEVEWFGPLTPPPQSLPKENSYPECFHRGRNFFANVAMPPARFTTPCPWCHK